MHYILKETFEAKSELVLLYASFLSTCTYCAIRYETPTLLLLSCMLS